MKYLVWIFVIAFVVMGFCWNYASNSSRYEHAKYLQAVYQGGVKNYTFLKTDNRLEFDSPSLASLRSVTPYNYDTYLPHDEMVEIRPGQVQNLLEQRKLYGVNSVTVRFYVPEGPTLFDWPWSQYLEINTFGLVCENEKTAYAQANCFHDSHADDDEAPNFANQIKALRHMNDAYYEAKLPEEKDKVLDEFLAWASGPIMIYETAATIDTQQEVRFRSEPVISTQFALLETKKVEQKWPKDACMKNAYFWLFYRNGSTPALRAQCFDQMTKKTRAT